MDKNTASKTKIVSIVISLGIIATLIIGVISVVRSVNSNRNNENNIVNLNETQENVAIKTEDVTDDVLGNIDDELQEANAGASMAVDTDNISNKADNTYNTHKAGTDDADKETEPTVPPTLSSEEVMAEAMKNFAFDESNKLAWPVLGQSVLKVFTQFMSTEIELERIIYQKEFDGKFVGCQIMDGDIDVFLGIAGEDADLLCVASTFSQEDMNKFDADAYDAICELINIINGAYATKLSYEEIEVSLHPPVFYQDTQIKADNGMYVVTFNMKGHRFNLLMVADDKVKLNV